MSRVSPDLSGRRFGRLIATTRAPSVNGAAWWHVVCDCGNKRSVRAQSLIRGQSMSCGCWRRESSAKRMRRQVALSRGGRKRYTLDEAWADVLAHCAAGLAATAKRARRIG